MTVKFVALGLDHRHIYGMTQHMLNAGAECVGFWSDGRPQSFDGFVKRFSDLHQFETMDDALTCGADLALVAVIPKNRCDLSISAMHKGMDVMIDKPGCISRTELDSLKACVAETGRIWSINFSERFEVPAVTRASELVAQGAIGRVVHTAGLGPHRLNKEIRPDWFFRRAAYGGILTDIASHQIDQFMHFTGSHDAEVTHAFVANYANPHTPELQDFGEITLRSETATGSIRVDWFTPDALPTWGDGRLTILGTEGYIELRKYIDVEGTAGTDHVILVNGETVAKSSEADAGLPYFSNLINDIRNRTEIAMTQRHCFKVMELALEAQARAESASK
ncbi:MAG: Gfo/Idh/MocA family oxidoreductase [Roseobacter sp.]